MQAVVLQIEWDHIIMLTVRPLDWLILRVMPVAFALGLLDGCTQRPGFVDNDGMPIDAVIIYEKSGGLHGGSEYAEATWTIYADGRIVSSRGEVKRTDASYVDDIVTKIRVAKLDRMAPNRAMQSGGDQANSKLTIRQGNGLLKVRGVDGSPGVPTQYFEIIDQLEELISTAR